MKYAVFDVETPNSKNDRMSSIAVTLIEDGKVSDSFYTLVNPETYFNAFNISLTGISPEAVADAPRFDEIWGKLSELFDGAVLVAHNAPFDMSVLSKCLAYYGIRWKNEVKYICTCQMARRLLPELPSKRLNCLCDYFGIELDHHNAKSDTNACAEILLRYIKMGEDPQRFAKYYQFSVY